MIRKCPWTFPFSLFPSFFSSTLLLVSSFYPLEHRDIYRKFCREVRNSRGVERNSRAPEISELEWGVKGESRAGWLSGG